MGVMFETLALQASRGGQSERPLHHGSALTGHHRQIGVVLNDAQHGQVVMKRFEGFGDTAPGTRSAFARRQVV